MRFTAVNAVISEPNLQRSDKMKRKVALITGLSRQINIGAAIGRALAKDGWDIAFTYWLAYDESMPWKSHPEDVQVLIKEYESYGAKVMAIEADLSNIGTLEGLMGDIKECLGSITAMILSHCHSVDRSIETSTVEEFDQHFDVNVRGSWLLIKYFMRQFEDAYGSGRIIALTSDHVVHNLPYGASKGALDRIVLAAAEEYRDRGITANVINPGAIDTGWMDEASRTYITESTFLNRLGRPEDCANLVEFLCSDKGKWINGQLIHSNGGVNY